MTTLPTDSPAITSPHARHAPSNTPALPADHDNNFDLLRFLLAMLVLAYHCFPLTNGAQYQNEPLANLTHGLETTGSLAVDAFFIISGFLIAMSWERTRSSAAYLKKRVVRIFPAFAAASLFSAFIVAPLFGTPDSSPLHPRAIGRLFASVFTLREYFAPGVFAHSPFPTSMTGPVWTIKYEFACYLLILLLGITTLLRRRWFVATVFLLSAALAATQYPIHAPGSLVHAVARLGHAPRLLPFFLAGCTFYLFRNKIPFSSLLALLSTATLIAGFFYLPLLPLALVIAFPYLLLWLAFQKHLAFPRFARYGDFSYGIYLFAFPIQQILVALFPHKLSPLTLFLLASPIAIFAGALSWHLVEKHFLRGRSRATAHNSPLVRPVY